MGRVSTKTEYVLGVDGGSTKSVAALADLDGRVRKLRKGPSCNYHLMGEKRAKKNLKVLLGSLFRDYSIRVAVLGLAGLDTKRDLEAFQRIVLSAIPGRTRVELYNDTKIALEDACGADPRILVISGTGSNVYGEYGNKKARAGGWDLLLADEGSSYDFGMRAIRAAVRSFDGRGEKTIFEQLVLDRSGAKDIPDFISSVYAFWNKKPNEFKRHIASFASLVDEACAIGDAVAKGIVRKGASELFLGARSVIQNLGVERKALCVGFTGSNFKAPLFKQLLARKIKQVAPRAHFVPDVNPVRGAVEMALRIARTSQ